jgi:hypothetical protein
MTNSDVWNGVFGNLDCCFACFRLLALRLSLCFYHVVWDCFATSISSCQVTQLCWLSPTLKTLVSSVNNSWNTSVCPAGFYESQNHWFKEHVYRKQMCWDLRNCPSNPFWETTFCPTGVPKECWRLFVPQHLQVSNILVLFCWLNPLLVY